MRFILFLFFAFACATPLMAEQRSMQEVLDETQQRYNTVFIGKSADDIIATYGAPSRRSKLDSGNMTMEYHAQRFYRMAHKNNETASCSLRFWVNAARRVFKIDEIGDQAVCAYFAATRERKSTYDYRGTKFYPR